MDGRLTRTNCYEAGDYVVPNALSPRDLVSRPYNMDKTVLSSSFAGSEQQSDKFCFCNASHRMLVLI